MRRLTMLVLIVSTLLVPATTHAFPLGAGEHPRMNGAGAEPSSRSLWRRRPPLVCPAASRCPDARPTFCLVDAPDRVLPRAGRRDPCPRGLGARAAAGPRVQPTQSGLSANRSSSR